MKLDEFKDLMASVCGELVGWSIVVMGKEPTLVEELVKQLMQDRAKVTFIYDDVRAATRLVNETEAIFGDRPLYVHCDINDRENLAGCVQVAGAQMSHIDLLVEVNDNREFSCHTPLCWQGAD